MPATSRDFERILKEHGVGPLRVTRLQGDRPKAKIDAIIRDVKAANHG